MCLSNVEPNLEKEVDKLMSIASVNGWVTEKDAELKKTLSKSEYNKIVRYVKHVRELIKEAQQKEMTEDAPLFTGDENAHGSTLINE